jgi:hypothetical protein
MKMKALCALGATFAAATAANAAFVGLTFENYVGAGWAANGFSGLTAWRIYADFNSPDDFLVSVFGSPLNPMSMSSSDGAFFNSIVANSLTAPLPLMPAIWSNQWDTYVTIGLDTNIGDATGLSPGFAGEVGDLAGNFTASNAAWFITPADPQGDAGNYPGNDVMIAQLVVAAGENASGTVSLQFEGGAQALDEQFATPAPGVLALLGLAGLAGTRRRR